MQGSGRCLCRALLRASLPQVAQYTGSDSAVHARQVHFPFPAYGNKLLAEALGQAVDEGLCRAVGVCNFSGEQLQELHGLLAQRSIPLASNQARNLVKAFLCASIVPSVFQNR